MRENRMYGSEGGEPGNRASLPLSTKASRVVEFDSTSSEPLGLEPRVGLSAPSHKYDDVCRWGL